MVTTSTAFRIFFSRSLWVTPKTLLLIYYNKSEIAKLDILGKQAVGADGNIDPTFRQIGQRCLEFLRGAEAAEHLDAHRKWLKTPFECFEMFEMLKL